MSKKYLNVVRIRMDFDNETFSYNEQPNVRLFESDTLQEVATKLIEFIEKRDGQLIELMDGLVVVFDTAETTITANVVFKELETTDKEIEEFKAILQPLVVGYN